MNALASLHHSMPSYRLLTIIHNALVSVQALLTLQLGHRCCFRIPPPMKYFGRGDTRPRLVGGAKLDGSVCQWDFHTEHAHYEEILNNGNININYNIINITIMACIGH